MQKQFEFIAPREAGWDRHTRQNIWRSRAVSLQLLPYEVRPRRAAECGGMQASEADVGINAMSILT